MAKIPQLHRISNLCSTLYHITSQYAAIATRHSVGCENIPFPDQNVTETEPKTACIRL